MGSKEWRLQNCEGSAEEVGETEVRSIGVKCRRWQQDTSTHWVRRCSVQVPLAVPSGASLPHSPPLCALPLCCSTSPLSAHAVCTLHSDR